MGGGGDIKYCKSDALGGSLNTVNLKKCYGGTSNTVNLNNYNALGGL